ncbi:MAG: hypothetical protein LBG83_01230 [Oscillospiraceae bacterium]|nr:hypothetical protein [Oscillospiraceae bacterium]
MSKYYATGTGSATAYIAKWDPKWANQGTNETGSAANTGQIGVWNLGLANHIGASSSGYQTFALENGSEVLADFDIWATYVDGYSSSAPTATGTKLTLIVMGLDNDAAGYGINRTDEYFYSFACRDYVRGKLDANATITNVGGGVWRVRIAPGKCAVVILNFGDNMIAGSAGSYVYKCKLFYTATQVD